MLLGSRDVPESESGTSPPSITCCSRVVDSQAGQLLMKGGQQGGGRPWVRQALHLSGDCQDSEAHHSSIGHSAGSCKLTQTFGAQHGEYGSDRCSANCITPASVTRRDPAGVGRRRGKKMKRLSIQCTAHHSGVGHMAGACVHVGRRERDQSSKSACSAQQGHTPALPCCTDLSGSVDCKVYEVN